MKRQCVSAFWGGMRRCERIIFVLVFVLSLFMFSHPDLWETANHSYVFLESVFGGGFLDFYEICAEHANTYYYINNANYNIVTYIIFGLWELPVFAFNKLFGLALNEKFLIFWAKCVSAAFYLGCGILTESICEKLARSEAIIRARGGSTDGALMFLLCPIAFFSPLVMGQYDSICLFFTLLAVCFYLDDKLFKSSIAIGVGITCKFFGLLIFIPLVLLKEKKLLNIFKYLLCSLWLYLPTTLLFWGRTGDAAAFTEIMLERLFTVNIDFGPGRRASAFLVFYAVAAFLCFIYTPHSKRELDYAAVYTAMSVFILLFLFIEWHPQWLVLLMPFITVTTLAQRNKTAWFLLDIFMSAGFFILCWLRFPGQCSGSLFNVGLAGFISGFSSGGDGYKSLSYFIDRIPHLSQAAAVFFAASLIINLIFKFPAGDNSLANKISSSDEYDAVPTRLCIWAVFAIGFVGCWFLPSLAERLNGILGII